ncbi:hypothetical protein RRG08_044340 [Elysia crispata]|uniref:Uncharacterized protein n=1 Tax=Elysia crispata TaxID=231223 RepID=A0AAE1DUA1_9GAST|nr:hypothetical protein RRG08_044340 [Elysia crispata]
MPSTKMSGEMERADGILRPRLGLAFEALISILPKRQAAGTLRIKSCHFLLAEQLWSMGNSSDFIFTYHD